MDRLEERLIAVEEKIAYAERTIGDLSDVLRSFGDRLDAQDRMLANLRAAIDKLSAAMEEPRTLEDEKPPHY